MVWEAAGASDAAGAREATVVWEAAGAREATVVWEAAGAREATVVWEAAEVREDREVASMFCLDCELRPSAFKSAGMDGIWL